MNKRISDEDTNLLNNMLKKEGEGNLLAGFITGKEKPHTEGTCDRVTAYAATPKGQTVHQEKDGKIIPYTPASRKELKTKKNTSLKI